MYHTFSGADLTIPYYLLLRLKRYVGGNEQQDSTKFGTQFAELPKKIFGTCASALLVGKEVEIPEKN